MTRPHRIFAILVNALLVAVSIGLLAVSFPRLTLWPCAFFCLIPLFLAIERSNTILSGAVAGIAWAVAFTAFMGDWLFVALVSHYGVSIHTSLLFVGLFVVFPLAVVDLAFIVLYKTFKRDSLVFYALVVPSAWIMMDYLKSHLSFLVPWGDIGYALMPFSNFVQVADITGVYGVSFLAVMVNAVLYYLLFVDTEQPAGKKAPRHRRLPGRHSRMEWGAGLAILVLAIAVPVVYGGFHRSAVDRQIAGRFAKGDGIPAVVVQGNFSLSDRWSGMGFDNRLKQYLALSRTPGYKSGERVIVWPETVLNVAERLDDAFFRQIMGWIGPDSLLISGGVYAIHHQGRTDYYNTAYFISGSGHLTRYDKHILLPYAEAVPPIDLLGQYYNAPEHFVPGRTPTCVRLPEGPIGASICLEILYPGYIRNSVADGARYLINVSNDAWFGQTAMPYIHFDAARMRAIENGRFVLRAANSGVSGIISPDGAIQEKSRLFTREAICGRLLKENRLTPYTRFGDWIIGAAGLILCLALLEAIIRR